jgi:hypothetical protein
MQAVGRPGWKAFFALSVMLGMLGRVVSDNVAERPPGDSVQKIEYFRVESRRFLHQR